jgi:hypothetical protein
VTDPYLQRIYASERFGYSPRRKRHAYSLSVGGPIASSDRAEGHTMVNLLSGIVVTVATAALFWTVLPTDGKPHRLATAPYIETALPLTVTCGLVLGVGLIIAGVVGFVQP